MSALINLIRQHVDRVMFMPTVSTGMDGDDELPSVTEILVLLGDEISFSNSKLENIKEQ